jgi:cysteinyl-tRNA synthetase
MRLYDSMTQEKKEFVPRDGDHVTMYFCGPTVYNYVHVGNARPYVVSMVAKRYFESLGYRVTLVENITDIDDRIINKGRAEGRDYRDVAKQFADAYREDTDRLGLGRPDVEPLATEHIAEIIALIAGLMEQGHAYQAGPDVYFDVDSWTQYGKLSKQQVAEMRHGARIDVGEDKADPLDFALWKGAKPGEPAWDSPWGPGRPGWHIECSAMSLKYLGAGFDIHGGGRDLIFPHHENEIAQAEAAGKGFARFWMHNGMLNLSSEKMSKSVGNIRTLRSILDRHRPEALITAFLGSHYRSPLEFSEDLLEETEQQVDRLRNLFRGLADRAADRAGVPGEASVGAASGTGTAAPPTGAGAPLAPADSELLQKVSARRQAFDEALADDLNTAAALAEVFGLAREVNAALAAGDLDPEGAAQVRVAMGAMVHVLGLDAVTGGEDAIPADVTAMAEERRAARAARDFARADALRAAISERGYEVRDAPDGFKIVPIR